MSKNILVFGCGELQESLIKNAKALGHFVVGIDINLNSIAREYCDEFIVVGGNDFEGTCKIVEKYKINSVVTAATDKPLIMMSRIAVKYAFPFPGIKSILQTTNKYFLKKVLINNSIPTAKYSLITGNFAARKDKEISFPLIVKPVDSSGSRGVVYCIDEKEFVDAINQAMNYSKTKKVLVEEYIPGEEFSIESLIYKKKLFIIQITEKTTTDPPFCVELGHLQPAQIEPELYNKIVDILNRMVSALNLDNCACHTEIKVNNSMPFIIENGARLGGDYITSVLTPLSTGVNMEKELIRISLGEEFLCPKLNFDSSYIKYFNFPEGVIDFDDNLLKDIKHENLIQIDFKLKRGQKVPIITNSLDRYGSIILKGKNRNGIIMDMNYLYNKIIEKVKVKV